VKFSLVHLLVWKKNLKKMAVLLLIIGLLYAVVCTPLYHITNTNILFRDGIASLLVDYLMDIMNYLYYWLIFAFLLFVGVTLGKTTLFGPYLLVIAATTVFRYFASLLSGYILNGIPTKWDVWSDDLLYLGIDVLMDFVQIAAVFLIVYSRAWRMTRDPKFVPVSKLTDRKNPVALTAAFLAAIPAVIHLITRVIFDIWKGYTPRSGGDLLWMILGYSSELLAFVAGYFVILLWINHLSMDAKAMKIAYDRAKGSILQGTSANADKNSAEKEQTEQ